VRDGHDGSARVSVERPVGAQLLDVAGRHDAGLLGELAGGGRLERLVGEDEPAGKGERAGERFEQPLDEQRLQAPVADCQCDDVHCHRQERGARG
jgi:hypothetical protein